MVEVLALDSAAANFDRWLPLILINVYRRSKLTNSLARAETSTIWGVVKKIADVSRSLIYKYQNSGITLTSSGTYSLKNQTKTNNRLRTPYSKEIIDVEDAISLNEFYDWLLREGYIKTEH